MNLINITVSIAYLILLLYFSENLLYVHFYENAMCNSVVFGMCARYGM
jgi:hypothetical protein